MIKNKKLFAWILAGYFIISIISLYSCLVWGFSILDSRGSGPKVAPLGLQIVCWSSFIFISPWIGISKLLHFDINLDSWWLFLFLFLNTFFVSYLIYFIWEFFKQKWPRK